MDDTRYDAYVPAEMARRAEASAIRKANRDIVSACFLAVQAGSFIALRITSYNVCYTKL